MEENMIVITDPKTSYFDFDWSKDVDENSKHKIKFILKSKKYLAKNKIKSKIEQLYCTDINVEIIFTKTENSKTNEPHKFVLQLSQRLE